MGDLCFKHDFRGMGLVYTIVNTQPKHLAPRFVIIYETSYQCSHCGHMHYKHYTRLQFQNKIKPGAVKKKK